MDRNQPPTDISITHDGGPEPSGRVVAVLEK